MLTRSILKRRELLMGLGGASFLAVPVFRDSLAVAQAGTFPVRFVPIFLPGSATDGKFNFSGVLSPLAAFQADSVSLSFDNFAAANIWGTTGEPHGAELRTLLTGDSSLKPQENASVWANSDSIDQTIAAQISSQLRFTTLQFGVVTETISNPLDQRRMIIKAGTPQPPIENPTEMFMRLFGNGAPVPAPTTTGSTPTPAPTGDPSADGKSMLDRLKAEVTALKAVAGVGEQAKLEQHLTSLRELEKQLVGVPSTGTGGAGGGGTGFTPGMGCAAPMITPVAYQQSYPPGSGPDPDIATVTSQQFELLYQSLTCDLTRVASMQLLGTAHTEVGYGWLGVTDDHHALEHNQSEAATGANLDKVQNFFAGEVAKFLNLLKTTPEGSGSMLDNTLVMFFTDFSNAGAHSHDELPFFLFGGGGGKVRTGGRTVAYDGTPHNQLLRGVLNVFGIDQAKVGDDVGGSAVSLA